MALQALRRRYAMQLFSCLPLRWFTAVCWALSVTPEAPSLAFLGCGERLARVRLAVCQCTPCNPSTYQIFCAFGGADSEKL